MLHYKSFYGHCDIVPLNDCTDACVTCPIGVDANDLRIKGQPAKIFSLIPCPMLKG